MIKILFMIHDLGPGGAEKVLVHLVNHMDHSKFQITVIALFGGGINERLLGEGVRYITVFPRMIPGNSKWMKLLSPAMLHRVIVREHYDIEVSYLEGPSARVISGCRDPEIRKITWIHCTLKSPEMISRPFRSNREAADCYAGMNAVVCVSEGVKQAFLQNCPVEKEKVSVLYNTNDSESIIRLGKEEVTDVSFDAGFFNWCAVGKLAPVKNFERALNVQKMLVESSVNARLYIIGDGILKEELKDISKKLKIDDTVFFLGYQTNPYKYMSKCDLFVCSSDSEGFSTAATEALILGIPVVTTDVSGMKELLGTGGEYGIITERDDKALFKEIRKMAVDKETYRCYKKQAEQRGHTFSTGATVGAAERFFESMVE